MGYLTYVKETQENSTNVEYRVDYKFMLAHSFDIRSHENQCEIGNGAGGGRSDSKIWEVVQCPIGAQILQVNVIILK